VDHGESEVLIEEIAEKLAHAQVGPATMYQQETLQELELRERVIRGQDSLDPFLPADAHADVSCYKDKR
jgi:hypothetical protein